MDTRRRSLMSNIYYYPPIDDGTPTVGDIVCANTLGDKLIVKTIGDIPNDYTPIGVVVIPTSHDVYGTGECGVMSLHYMTYTTPDVGSSSPVKIYFGSSADLPNLTNFTDVNYVGSYNKPTGNLQGSSDVWGATIPSDAFTYSKSLDGVTYYANTSSNYYTIPSPYHPNGSRNRLYYTTELSNLNALSDFDGYGNTYAVLDWVSVTDWKTLDTLTNSSSSGMYPAAMCCWRYNTIGTNKGDWYIPACGELGYILNRQSRINETLQALRDSGLVSNVALLDFSDMHWTSTEYTSSVRTIGGSYGRLYYASKGTGCYVRACYREKTKLAKPINVDDYLTIEALENGLTVKLSVNDCEYCVDGDGNWKTLTAGTTTDSINTGHTLSFRGSLVPDSTYGIGTFTVSSRFNLRGNCMSMLFGNSGKYVFSLSGKTYAFMQLFQGCTKLISVSENFLPATTLVSYCYKYMFDGCTNLQNAPLLPALTVYSDSYRGMFYDCVSLQTAPDLPATSVSSYGYMAMFNGCKSLKQAPYMELLTSLQSYVYSDMFMNCTSLETGPESIGGTSYIYSYACANMFNNCTSLKYAPKLLATSSAKYLYYRMFYGCSNLLEVRDFKLVSPGTDQSCGGMFQNCSNLSYIECNFKEFTGHPTNNWIQGLCANGTMVLPSATGGSRCPGPYYHQIPALWTIDRFDPITFPLVLFMGKISQKVFDFIRNYIVTNADTTANGVSTVSAVPDELRMKFTYDIYGYNRLITSLRLENKQGIDYITFVEQEGDVEFYVNSETLDITCSNAKVE